MQKPYYCLPTNCHISKLKTSNYSVIETGHQTTQQNAILTNQNLRCAKSDVKQLYGDVICTFAISMLLFCADVFVFCIYTRILDDKKNKNVLKF